MLILPTILKIENFLGFNNLCQADSSVLQIFRCCTLKIETIGKLLNSSQTIIRLSAGNFLSWVWQKLQNIDIVLGFNNLCQADFSILKIFRCCSLKIETIDKLLNSSQTIVRQPRGTVMLILLKIAKLIFLWF